MNACFTFFAAKGTLEKVRLSSVDSLVRLSQMIYLSSHYLLPTTRAPLAALAEALAGTAAGGQAGALSRFLSEISHTQGSAYLPSPIFAASAVSAPSLSRPQKKLCSSRLWRPQVEPNTGQHGFRGSALK